jgi:hypothetical protein
MIRSILMVWALWSFNSFHPLKSVRPLYLHRTSVVPSVTATFAGNMIGPIKPAEFAASV